MMKSKLGQEPAFSFVYEKENIYGEKENVVIPGMSKRFYTACAAMQAMIQCGAFNVYRDLEKCIETSYKFADELLKQEKEEEDEVF